MDNIDTYIHSETDDILNTVLIVLNVLAAIAVSMSVFRSIQIGWQPAMNLHIIILIIISLLTFYRKSMPYNLKCIIILSLYFIAATVGLITFGLVGAGMLLLIGFVLLTGTLYGIKIGIFSSIISFILIIFIGAVVVSGHVHLSVDSTQYATNFTSWLNAFTAFILVAIMEIIVVAKMKGMLLGALEKTFRQKKELEQTLEKIQQLEGIIPICSYCHRIRNDTGAWDRLEHYISKHTEAKFSHGVCPNCIAKLKNDMES